MWFHESIFYQIYPFGFLDAPDENDGITVERISKVKDWIPHLKKLGVNAIYFCPVFESDSHGYDTRDFGKIDCRIGSNHDFSLLCKELHENDIRVVLDGVFNHVGRGFWAFRDLLEKRENSQYRDWFHVDFNSNSNYNDGLWYEGWEGHFNLVKLNLHNPHLVEHLLSCVRLWIEEFKIDGLRLDVAYSLDEDFMRQLRSFVKSIDPDFFLIGELIHGDYNRIVNPEMLDSCTNYECFKGIHSSFNSLNMFEIAHSLKRQFGADQWALYRNLPLMTFLDNHDVSRIASELKNPEHLKAAYALEFAMPGIPSIYYGSEWGARGEKTHGTDKQLRPYFEKPVENDLTKWIAELSELRKNHPALSYGDYNQLYLTNKQFVFSRSFEGSMIIIAINADSEWHTAHLQMNSQLQDLLNPSAPPFSCSAINMRPYSASFYKTV